MVLEAPRLATQSLHGALRLRKALRCPALGELAREPDSERFAHEHEFATGRELREKADFALFEVARLESAEDR
jgi:hypothetical protein